MYPVYTNDPPGADQSIKIWVLAPFAQQGDKRGMSPYILVASQILFAGYLPHLPLSAKQYTIMEQVPQ